MPFGSAPGQNSSSNIPQAPMRGQSLPRSMGSSTTPSYTKKPDMKKQGSITNLLSMAVPDAPPPSGPPKPPKQEPVLYNPYAPKKPSDDSNVNYREMNGNHKKMTNGNKPPQTAPVSNDAGPSNNTFSFLSNGAPKATFTASSQMPMPPQPVLQAKPSGISPPSIPMTLSMPSQVPSSVKPMVSTPPIPIPTQQQQKPIQQPQQSATPPPPAPPPPPKWDQETQTFVAPKLASSKVANVHAQLHNDKMQKLEVQRQEELERKRLEELERQRLEELERQRLEELERKRQEELERQRLEELERMRQEEMERKRQEELERQRLEECSDR